MQRVEVCLFEVMGKAWVYNAVQCFPLSHLDAHTCVQLGQPGSATQLFHLPAAFSTEVSGVEGSQWTYLKNSAHFFPWDTVGILEEIPLTSSGTVLNILPFFSNLPTLHGNPCLLSLNQPCCFILFSFCIPFLFFSGGNQEKIWEQGLPVSAGEWHSVVWVSTLLFSRHLS